MKQQDIYTKLGIVKTSASEHFHNQTKISALPQNPPSSTDWPQEWKTVNFKGYPRLPRIMLPPVGKLSKSILSTILLTRQSRRGMDSQAMNLKKLSTLLYYSAGIKKGAKSDVGARTYPSAGARYPLEIYLLARNIKGLPIGLYHYHVKSHSLEELTTDANIVENIQKSFNQKWLNDSSAIFLISSIFWRNKIKYSDRGYRYSLLDAGHLCQNMYLVSEALQIACCEVGGFEDDGLHNALDLDGINEAILVAMSVGEKEEALLQIVW